MFVCRLTGKIVEQHNFEDLSKAKCRRDIIPKCDCKVRMYINYQKKKLSGR